MSSTLFAPFIATFNRATGNAEIAIEDFLPLNTVAAPAGTTHFQLFSAVASIDFEKESSDVNSVLSGELPYNATATISLKCSIPANSTNPVFVILRIEFMQQVNSKFYSLKNGTFNACSLVKADSVV